MARNGTARGARGNIGGDGRQVIATYRNAYRDFDLLETAEAGIVLQGSEVKSLREGHVQFADANVWMTGGEAFLMGVHIAPWATSAGFGGHDPDRRRKLLLHKAEIERLAGRQAQEQVAVVPLQLYFLDGHVKVEIALARGRKKGDRRQELAKRDAELETRRAMARSFSGKDRA
ncbi:MAG: SsrA-binding protein SmpB [Acidimicrobiia bacterium]|jgi:SsrA-binding protein|nr:SsrA-binding protein SmpB [Acidimicrobiia bacterium]